MPRFAVALMALVVSGPLFLSGCRSNLKSDASIAIGKDAPEITLGPRKAALPKGEVGETPPTVMQDRTGKRLAYRTTGGMARIVYVIGDGLFLGPLVPISAKDKVDFKAVPSVDFALATLFETASNARRPDLVKEIRREKGEAGIVRLLIDAVYVDDVAWEETRRTLSADREKELRDGLYAGLDAGRPSIVLRRSLGVVDLKAEWRKKMIPERAKELVEQARRSEAEEGDDAAASPRHVRHKGEQARRSEAEEGDDAAASPRHVRHKGERSDTVDLEATAVMLRAAVYHDKKAAAAVACDALALKENDHNPMPWMKLREAAFITLLVTDSTCPNQEIATAITESLADACLPYYRCNAEGPLSWRTTSRQDEPLCDRDQILKAAQAELDRPAKEVLDSGSSRASLFAFGLALRTDSVPSSFTTAHERRLYAIPAMPSEPACDPSALAAGTPCHCDEAVVRNAACKGSGAQVEAFTCRFDVDDKAKTISNVVVGTPGNHPH